MTITWWPPALAGEADFLALAGEADFLVSRDGHLHRAALPDLEILYRGEFCRLLEASELR